MCLWGTFGTVPRPTLHNYQAQSITWSLCYFDEESWQRSKSNRICSLSATRLLQTLPAPKMRHDSKFCQRNLGQSFWALFLWYKDLQPLCSHKQNWRHQRFIFSTWKIKTPQISRQNHGHWTLVFTVNIGHHRWSQPNHTQPISCIASFIAQKSNERYPEVDYFICTRASVSLLTSTILCMRRCRSQKSKKPNEIHIETFNVGARSQLSQTFN